MVKISALAGAALLVATQASAITFDFAWTGDPTENAALVLSDDPTARISGTLEIDAGPGEAFTQADILSVNLSVTGDAFTDFTTTGLTVLAGTISPTGDSASLSDIFDGAGVFGCRAASGNCIEVSSIALPVAGHVFIDSASAPPLNFRYTSDAAARAAWVLTAQTDAEVPLPATAALLIGALGGLAWARRRRGA